MGMPELDRELARIRDTLPRLWWSLYTGAVAAGFTSEQAMALTQTYYIANTMKSYVVQSPAGPEPGDK